MKYKEDLIHLEFPTKSHSIDWLSNYLLRRLYFHEKIVLKNSDEEDIWTHLSGIVGFISSSGNMAVSYIFTQKKRTIDVFKRKCINISPLFHDPPGETPLAYK